MKKICSVMLSALFLFCLLNLNVTAQTQQMQVEVKAKSAVLMEATTGEVLMSMNEHEKVYPASVTKIMSLLLITEAIDQGKIALTDVVTASKEASQKGGSQIWLKEGEQMTVDDLLKATAVASANDACTALGEFVAGSETAFVKMMNDRAKELGMNDTVFENCTGLDDTAENHTTSAYDVALMSAELIKHDRIRNYTTIWMDTLRGGETQLVNTNKLIRFYEGATGLKTGTTSKAGCCVSATAQRDGISLIAVVMGSESSNDRFDGAKAMLDWGFANYSAVELSVDPSLIADVTVIGGDVEKITPVAQNTFTAIVKKGCEDKITVKTDLALDVQAPVENNQVLGTVEFFSDGKSIGKINLCSQREIEKMNFIDYLSRFMLCLCT